jgi:hypothetical protein
VEKVNEYVISLLPMEEKEYLSCDTICKSDEDTGVDYRWITTMLWYAESQIKFENWYTHYVIEKYRYIDWSV